MPEYFDDPPSKKELVKGVLEGKYLSCVPIKHALKGNLLWTVLPKADGTAYICMVKLLRDGKKCTIHGLKSSQTKRAFIHVYDVVLATEAVFLRGTSGQVYNISSDYELSVMDVTRMIIRIVRNTTQYDDWIEYVEDRPFNDERYYICDTKLRQLGWKPEKTIKDLELFIAEN
jgi:nucleoside-diphosphate-sugar epimerase